jgi:predicted double-glycine peptidase
VSFYSFYGIKNITHSETSQKNNLTATPTSTPTSTPLPLPTSKIIENDYHVFQTFNNCGPAALSMALSYYGINKSQEELGQELRPYQNPHGDNDDKSVTLDELADKAKEFGLIPFHRPNGTITLLKLFIANNIPVITRTLLKEDDDIGHYRVIKGYDDTIGELIQDDSMDGHNLRYSYSLFERLWQAYNYEYLIFVPKDKEQIAASILGEDRDEKTSWEKAAKNSEKELSENPDNIFSRFNLSVALYHLGNFQQSVSEFEMVEDRLPPRTLWYQTEPILAYFKLGDDDKVFALTDKIINNQNHAVSELYIVRGEVYKKQGNITAAREEFEKAVYYNVNLKSAQEALNSIR